MNQFPGESSLSAAVAKLFEFYGQDGLTSRLADLEWRFQGLDSEGALKLLGTEGITREILAGAVAIKKVSGQINVAIHALGIMLALPVILEPDEVVEETSMGAGNTNRPFDLVTNRRVAEFKFTTWRGGPEPVRQNELFSDIFHLANAKTDKRREMYVTELRRPEAFLNNRRALGSVLHKQSVASEFKELHGDKYRVVRDYWLDVKHKIKLINIVELVPEIAGLPEEMDL